MLLWQLALEAANNHDSGEEIIWVVEKAYNFEALLAY